MKMIDFKGFKFVLIENRTREIELIQGPFMEYPLMFEFNNYQYSKMNWTLHTNPDYKEKEMIENEDFEKVTGTVKDEVLFYTGIYAALKTNHGNLTLMAPTFDELEVQAKKVMGSHFVLDESKTKRIGLTAEDNITKARTSEEKAIDDMKLSYDNWGNEPTEKDTFQWVFDDIKAGKIHGITFTEGKK